MLCPNCQAENADAADVCFTCGRALAALTQGSLIGGRYEIRGVLGKGGMGMVYRAHDRMLDEPVAIKVLRQELAATPAMAERFRSEIKLARKVSHPNVCRIHDYGQDAGMSFISMELLEGIDLKRRLSESPNGLPHEEAFSAALQLGRGLGAIHEVGIIHRDLKTPNAMRDSSGTIKLMDFGIAKSSEGRGQTATGEVMGTPEYMSPEQCRGEKLDARSDIYALGVVIYELFTGQVPFRGENMMATLFKQIGEPVPVDGPPGERLPRRLVPVIEKALAKDRADRYQNVGDLVTALRRAQKSADASPQPAPPVPEPAPVAAAAAEAHDGKERRGQSRLEIHLNVFLCRLDSKGGILHEERTVADNVSRHGARVMTSVPDLEKGDQVVLKEVGGDFTTTAVVRHAFVGPDHIPRVGLEFVSQGAPDRLVRTDDERRETPRPGQVRTPTRPTPVVPIAPIGPTPLAVPAVAVDRRRHSRIAISVDVQLRWLAPDGSTRREERTVADNVSRTGARVLTSITEMKTGDRVALREIGADFETDAIVRNAFVGKDNIPRVGVEFIGKTAPDRLLPTSEDEQRTTGRVPRAKPPQSKDPQPPAPTPTTPPLAQPPAPEVPAEERRKQIRELHASLATMSHFEFLGLDRRARESDVKQAYVRMARQYHPDAARDPALQEVQGELNAIFVRLSEAYEVLRDPEKRGRYESRIGRKAGDRMSPPSVSRVSPPSAGPAQKEEPAPAPPAPPPPETDEDRSLRIDNTLRTARKHLASAEYWEVIRLLEPLLEETAGTRLNIMVRLVLAQAMAKNPNWLKRAEELVVVAVRDDPKNADAHFLLGSLHRQAGLAARARTSLRRALELDPTHSGAAAELEAMEGAPKGRGR